MGGKLHLGFYCLILENVLNLYNSTWPYVPYITYRLWFRALKIRAGVGLREKGKKEGRNRKSLFFFFFENFTFFNKIIVLKWCNAGQEHSNQNVFFFFFL